jgi:hypothetical protein
MTCPECEYHKRRAALWRAEAYKQAGHDVIERPWVGLTDEEIGVPTEPIQPNEAIMFARVIEALIKGKNGG